MDPEPVPGKLEKKPDVFSRMNDLKKTRTLPQFLLRDIQNVRTSETHAQVKSCPPSPQSLNMKENGSNDGLTVEDTSQAVDSPISESDDSNSASGTTSLFQKPAISASASKLSKLLGSDDSAVARYQRIMNGRPLVFSPNNSHYLATGDPVVDADAETDSSSPVPIPAPDSSSHTLALPDLSQMRLSRPASPAPPRAGASFGSASLTRKEAKLTQLLGKGIVTQGVLQRVKQPDAAATTPRSFSEGTLSVVACEGGECLVTQAPKGPPPVFRSAYRSPTASHRSASPATERSKANVLLGEEVQRK